MLTEAGVNALWKFILIVVAVNVVAAVLNTLLGWEDIARYGYCFFLFSYIINNEQKSLELKKVQKLLTTNRK